MGTKFPLPDAFYCFYVQPELSAKSFRHWVSGLAQSQELVGYMYGFGQR